MDLVSGKTAVVQRFQEEADSFEKVDIGIDERVRKGSAVEELVDVGHKLHLCHCRFSLCACIIVSHSCVRHATSHGFNLFIG